VNALPILDALSHPPRRAQAVTAALGAILIACGVLAARRLPFEFHRLLTPGVDQSAVDLRMRWIETQAWFTGQPVYPAIPGAVYPPQTYCLLRPFIGYGSLMAVRWGWAITSIIAIAFLAGLMMQQTRRDRLAVPARPHTALGQGVRQGLVFLASAAYLAAMYPTGVTIGNGQLILHILCFLLPALLMLWKPSASLLWDLSIALLLQAPLAKLTVGLPFMWIVLLVPLARRATVAAGLRPAIFTAGLYILLTLWGAAGRAESLPELLRQWVHNTANATHRDYGNVHSLLAALGRERWSTPAGLVLGALFGWWVWFARGADRWILIGAASVFARLWSYHRVYDDLLVLPAMMALAHLAIGGARTKWLAALLLVVDGIAMLVPARRVNEPSAGAAIFQPLETAIWLLMLFYLLWIACRPAIGQREAISASRPALR
jgi:hypothetical protein